ncbi:MAG: FAD-dependent oxidoreductase [Gammaproteobacteria bacterium]
MNTAFDLVIVGGGAVGLSMALNLARDSQHRILVIEARDLEQLETKSDRSMALSLSSQKFYAGLQLWEQLALEVSPIKMVHVSMQHHYGTTRIQAKDYSLPALGYVLPLSYLEKTLLRALRSYSNVTVWSNAKLLSVTSSISPVLTVEKEGALLEVNSRLLVGTDGAQSQVAKSCDIPYSKTEYGHIALICHVNHTLSHEGVAYERFTQEGALAFLPFGEKRSTFVWTVSQSKADKLLQLSDEAYLQSALKAFGYRLGRLLSCTPRVTFPLIQSIAEKQWHEQIVLVGNSAHTLHPIAAQGLNLSLRAVIAFCETIKQDLIDPTHSQLYLSKIKRDQSTVTWITNQIAKQVSSARFPGALKASLMVGLDGLKPIKDAFARMSMGFPI